MIKIKFVDVHWEFDKNNNFIISILKNNNIEYEFSDQPDFLFFPAKEQSIMGMIGV